MNGKSYYPAASTLAQRAPVGSRPATALDPSTGPHRHTSRLSSLVDEKETAGIFGSLSLEPEQRLGQFSGSQRAGQEPTYFNGVGGGPSRDSGLPPTSQPESELPTFGYGASGANSMHSQRPSLTSGLSFNALNPKTYDQAGTHRTDEAEISERIGRMTMDSDLNGAHYRNGAQSFQFNPVSQPWENSQAYPNGLAREGYGNGSAFERRGSAALDRSSSAGSTYRPGAGLSSPRGFAAPQSNSEAWSRPASRDHRSGADIDRRGLGFYPPQHPYYSQGYLPYPLYDPYSGLRHVPIPGFDMPLPAYPAAAAGLPMQRGRGQDPGTGIRSLLLEEFRSAAKADKRYELKDLYEHVIEFCGDQHGSRFIQTKLETANSDEKNMVFREIEPNAVQLMQDVFGNYVIQKFFEHGDLVQKRILFRAMKGKIVDLSMQKYGCRVVQKALKHVLVEEQVELAKELEPDILSVIKDEHGNHVVSMVMDLVPRQHIDFIMDSFKGRVGELSAHVHGCRVVQKALMRGNEADIAAIMKELHASAHSLLSDQYGNYVIQKVLDKGKPEDRARIISTVTPMALTYAKNKHASNVVEKCIRKGTTEERRAIRDQIVKAPGNDGNSPLLQVMKDQYGNYVMQTLLNTLQGQDREDLLEQMKAQVAIFKATAVGKNTAIDRLVAAMAAPVDANNNANADADADSNSNGNANGAGDNSSPQNHTPPSSAGPSSPNGKSGEREGPPAPT
ncbi:ARM repeat-containing protein [Canariomyces notabilis]|uniref:ARM repeat-containing protein n=1 Tax=Canariomyces notabilis TaxID=2074819 RepID=A0AAN6TIH4_9PEZI|nr:ARM repeat-containing protein [Canariomyces arenarius]